MREMVEKVARRLHLAHYERGRGMGPSWEHLDKFEREMWRFSARAAMETMRELPENPGPRYTAGEYSRANQSAMVDDALGVSPS